MGEDVHFAGTEEELFIALHDGEMAAETSDEKLFFSAMKLVVPGLASAARLFRGKLAETDGNQEDIARTWAGVSGAALQVGCNFAVSLVSAIVPHAVMAMMREDIIRVFTRCLDRRIQGEAAKDT
jgi:hypothetical protein